MFLTQAPGHLLAVLAVNAIEIQTMSNKKDVDRTEKSGRRNINGSPTTKRKVLWFMIT